MDLAIIYETGKARRLVMQSLIVSVIALGVTGLAIWMTDSLLVVGWMVLIESIVLLFVMRRLSGLNDNSVATDSAILLTLAAGFAVWWLKYVGNADFLTVAVTAVISILVLMIAYHMRIVGAAMRIRRMLWS